MSQRFGQASDFSQNYAFLAQQNYIRMEQAAERIDRQREEELASEDAAAFTKYQEGKLSGQEILAYIQRRIKQTSYDKAQQNKWKATLIEYQNAVADETATAEYEKTGNIGAFIAHWNSRLQGTKKGSPEYTQIQSVLSDLREQRDQKQLKNGADRLMREILKGKKSTKDLIDYYRDALQKGGLSAALRSQIKDTIAELTAKHRQEQYQVSQLKVDEKLARGDISPQEAAKQKRANADKWGIAQSDPVSFQQLLGEIRVLNATPDPVEVARAEADLKAGKISAAQFSDKMEEWADMIAPFDQKAAWQLRGDARSIRQEYEAAQRLENPGAIGQTGVTGSNVATSRAAMTVNTFIGKRLQHISQLDGTAYSQLNCAMAAGAMMGYTLGVKGLTAGDLRAESGDQSGGTTLLQVKSVLARHGVDTLRYKDGYSYEKFLTNIKQGSTALVSGYLGAVKEGEMNNGGWVGANHTVYVARYDPQKGFLILDSALRSSKGYWMSEDAFKRFAWNSGYGMYSRNGSVLLSPKGTLKTQWNKGKTYDPRKTATPGRAKVAAEQSKAGDKAGERDYDSYINIDDGLAFISVEEPAKTEAGKAYQGQFNPGPDVVTPIIDAWNAERVRDAYDNPAHRARLEAAGITPGDSGLDTRDEVVAEINRRTQAVSDLRGWVGGFAEVYDGSEGPFMVVNGSQSQMLTREDISRMERELVVALDGLGLLNTAIGNQEGVDLARSSINDIILLSQTVTATDQNWERAQLFQNVGKILDSSGNGIESTRRALEDVASVIEEFNANWQPEPEVLGPPTEAQMPTEQTQAIDQLGQVPDVLGEGKDAVQFGNFGTDLDTLLQAALDPATPPEVVQQTLLQFAEQYDIELPPNWPEPMDPGDTSPGGLGDVLTNIIGNAEVVWNIDNGMGELVYYGGEQHYVPYVRTGGTTAQGNAAEGFGVQTVGDIAAQTGQEVPEGTDPNAQLAYGTGGMRVLDLDYIQNTLGIELPQEWTLSADAIPKAFVLVDGEPTAVTVIPQQVPYEGANMLQIRDDGKESTSTYIDRVKDYLKSVGITPPNGLEEGGMLSRDQLASLPPGVVRQLLQGGENSPLVAQPYLVWTMQLPGQKHPWFMDPETEKWHYDGLPFVTGSSPFIPGADKATSEITGWIGARFDEKGQAVPDSTGWDVEAYGTTGVPTPMGEGIDLKTANIMQQNGEGNANTMLTRDPLSNDIRTQTEEETYDEYINISSAREATSKAIELAKKAANDAFQRIRDWAQTPEERQQLLAGESTAFGGGGPGFAGLELVGATDMVQEENKLKQGGYTPPAKNFLMDFDIQKTIRTGIDSLSQMDFSKLDFSKPYETTPVPATSAVGQTPGGVQGMTYNEEFGYQKVSSSNEPTYTPPKPDSTDWQNRSSQGR